MPTLDELQDQFVSALRERRRIILDRSGELGEQIEQLSTEQRQILSEIEQIEENLQALNFSIEPSASPAKQPSKTPAKKPSAKLIAKKAARSNGGPPDYEKVAADIRDRRAAGGAVTSGLAELYNVPKTTVNNWMTKCRKLGLIDTPKQDLSGEPPLATVHPITDVIEHAESLLPETPPVPSEQPAFWCDDDECLEASFPTITQLGDHIRTMHERPMSSRERHKRLGSDV